MQITDQKVVIVSYQLHANLPLQARQHIETADAQHPLSFLYGTGSMIPGFEKGLEGKGKGDKFSFTIEPDQGYGSADDTAIINLPIDIFKVDNVIDFNMLKIGNVLPLSDQEGNVLNGKVLSFDDKVVRMDFNHPLAGHQLHFTGEVLEVRDASVEELAHGHVH